MIKYNLGSGRQKLEGYINVDIRPFYNPDLEFDLNKFPYPINSSSVDEIRMHQVLEHLSNIQLVLEECYRILKPGGKLIVEVPYAHSTWAVHDVTHEHFFTERSMDSFCNCGGAIDYTQKTFIKEVAELYTNNHNLTSWLRTMIPFRSVLKMFFNNMYDGVRYVLVKP